MKTLYFILGLIIGLFGLVIAAISFICGVAAGTNDRPAYRPGEKISYNEYRKYG